jgi:hypothetical protein
MDNLEKENKKDIHEIVKTAITKVDLMLVISVITLIVGFFYFIFPKIA